MSPSGYPEYIGKVCPYCDDVTINPKVEHPETGYRNIVNALVFTVCETCRASLSDED